MAECHARLMAVAKHGTPEAFSATLAGVLQRAELSISNAYDAGAKSIQVEAVAAPAAANEITKAFREYLTVHPSIKFGGHEADTVARELALIVCAVGQAAALTQGAESNMTGSVLDADALSRIETALMMTIEPETAEVAIALLRAQGAAIAAGAPVNCMGPSCLANRANGYAHSRECLDEAGESQGWTPRAEDYAKCGPSAPSVAAYAVLPEFEELDDTLIDPADIIAGALQISRGHAIEIMQQAVDALRASHGQAPAQSGDVRAACSQIIKTLAEIVNAPQTDAQMDAEVVPRDPLMWRVQQIRTQVDAIYKACLSTPAPQAARQAPAKASRFADVLEIQRSEGESTPSDAYMVGLYNGMSMMDANYRGSTDWEPMSVAQVTPAAPSTPASGGWISVDERLPEVGVTVLVYEPFRHGEDWPDTVRIFFDYICPDYEGWHNHCASYEHFMVIGGANACGPDVTCTGPSEKAPYTHWMPLPASPTIEGESK